VLKQKVEDGKSSYRCFFQKEEQLGEKGRCVRVARRGGFICGVKKSRPDERIRGVPLSLRENIKEGGGKRESPGTTYWRKALKTKKWEPKYKNSLGSYTSGYFQRKKRQGNEDKKTSG